MFTRSQFLIALAVTGAVSGQTPWLDVPFVQQKRAGCGSAAVAMVVGYWARQLPELAAAAQDAEHIDDLLPPSARGIRGQELKRYLEQRGFNVYLFDGEMSDLRQHFERGRPIIVCLGLGGPKRPLHYAVVVGVEESVVWLNDSARGKLFREDLRRFEKAWDATGRWAMLAVPRVAQRP